MDTKQVIVIRKDLHMRKGKMVAQGGHAVMKVFFDLMQEIDANERRLPLDEEMKHWIDGNYRKVTVSVNSEEELLQIYEMAKQRGLRCSIIQDNGLTEFHGVKTYTAVAVGPNEESKVNEVTGHLPLL